jgi:hypothetical protein
MWMRFARLWTFSTGLACAGREITGHEFAHRDCADTLVRELPEMGSPRFNVHCLLLMTVALVAPVSALAQGLDWPTNQFLPAFATPAPVLDCIDVSSVGAAQHDLFTSLAGIVNREQPRIACVVGGQEGAFTWLNLHKLPYSLVNGFSMVLKYRTHVNGLVVTDTNQPHTLNLATTIAGVNDLLICDPGLLPTLTNAPYNLPVIEDLRGRFSDKFQVYRHLYTNYWPQCTKRIMAGMNPDVHGHFRDYLVATKSATVWLDPATLNLTDRSVLAMFLSEMAPARSVYTGWWPSEANGLNFIASYGIPVLASDFMINATVFSGVRREVVVPETPPPPPLQNKVHVALLLSDGDNIQYMQHAMKIRWDNSARGSIPIGWTVSPLALDMDPVMLDFYWSTATKNDCLVSGPSGAGYAQMQKWSSANLTAFSKASAPYLERSGVRVITVWDQVTTGVARSFATNCPSLLGLTDQSGGNYVSFNLGLATVGLTPSYSSSTNSIYDAITNAARNWNGTAPMFIAGQGNVWDITPSDLRTVANLLDTNKYVLVRPDHLFLLLNRITGKPQAVTKGAREISTSSARIEGFVVPNATNTLAWLEWGTNNGYGATTPGTNVAGGSVVLVRAPITGLAPRTIYHYRVVASNALGVVRGAHRQFTTGGRVKSWGQVVMGQDHPAPWLTNVVGVGAGDNHGLALKNDGTVVAWGDSASGQTNVPTGLSNVVEVAGGVQHSVALRANGTVIAWGDNSLGQTNVPVGLSNVVAIASGGHHVLALKADGMVAAWGSNLYGQTNVPSGLSNVVAVACGWGHSVVLKADGTLTSWGYNNAGQTNAPASLGGVAAVSARQHNSLALKADSVPVDHVQPASRWVADSLVGANNSAVSNWADMAGGARAVQTTATRQPRLILNAMNGHNVVRFTSSSLQHLTVGSTNSAMAAAGSFSQVVVFKTSTPGVPSSLFYQNTGILGAEQPGVVADWALCLNGSQLGVGLGAGTASCGGDLSAYAGNVTDDRTHVAVCVRQGETLTLYVDGVPTLTQSPVCTAPRGNYTFHIGAMLANSLCFNGDLAEIQLFTRALNAAEVATVSDALAATYGINGGRLGRVLIWGNTASGQTNVPTHLTNVISAVSGGPFNVALNAAGGATAWGANNAGQTNLPPGLTNVAALAAGGAFGLAIGDQIPWASNLAVTGYVNCDLTVTLPGGDPDLNPLVFRISALPEVGTLYQHLDGSRGPAIVAPATVVSDPEGRVLFAPAPDQAGLPHAQFAFAVENDFFNAGPATVTVHVVPPAAPMVTGAAVSGGGGLESFQLGFVGSTGAPYNVWASTNLLDWTHLGPATEAPPGQYSFTDTTAPGWPQRFYRINAP